MNEGSDTIEITIHIPKSGIFFLGRCIRYAWDLHYRTDTLLPIEEELLDGRLEIKNILKSFISLRELNEELQKNCKELESQVEEIEAQADEVYVEERESLIEELQAQVEELRDQVESLLLLNEYQ